MLPFAKKTYLELDHLFSAVALTSYEKGGLAVAPCVRSQAADASYLPLSLKIGVDMQEYIRRALKTDTNYVHLLGAKRQTDKRSHRLCTSLES